MIQANDTILFQGDSITDCGRGKNDTAPNSLGALGQGYPKMVAGRLLRQRPEDALSILNRGIGGNRVVDLYARWKSDAINLNPDLISILVGVNDTWHEFGSQNGVEVHRYEIIYRMLLDLTKERLPEVKLVLCEPFVLQYGAVTADWLDEMAARRSIVKQLASDYDARFVPFQRAFDNALKSAGPDYWTGDGVHPTVAGHCLMADTWLETVGT